MDLVNKLVVFTRVNFRLSCNVFVKKSPSFQNVDIFQELDRCTPCVFILGTVARFSRNKSLLISFGAPVILGPNKTLYGVRSAGSQTSNEPEALLAVFTSFTSLKQITNFRTGHSAEKMSNLFLCCGNQIISKPVNE